MQSATPRLSLALRRGLSRLPAAMQRNHIFLSSHPISPPLCREGTALPSPCRDAEEPLSHLPAAMQRNHSSLISPPLCRGTIARSSLCRYAEERQLSYLPAAMLRNHSSLISPLCTGATTLPSPCRYAEERQLSYLPAAMLRNHSSLISPLCTGATTLPSPCRYAEERQLSHLMQRSDSSRASPSDRARRLKLFPRAVPDSSTGSVRLVEHAHLHRRHHLERRLAVHLDEVVSAVLSHRT